MQSTHPPIAPLTNESPFFFQTPDFVWWFRAAISGHAQEIINLPFAQRELCACWQRCAWADEARRLCEVEFTKGIDRADFKALSKSQPYCDALANAEAWREYAKGE